MPKLKITMPESIALILNMARFRHKKRGTEYIMLFSSRVQASTGPIIEGDTVVVYMDVNTGVCTVRKHDEFHEEGRFERLEQPT